MLLFFQVIIALIVIGVLLWLANKYIPMDPTIKSIINAVVVIAVVLFLLWLLLSMFGMVGPIGTIHIGK